MGWGKSKDVNPVNYGFEKWVATLYPLVWMFDVYALFDFLGVPYSELAGVVETLDWHSVRWLQKSVMFLNVLCTARQGCLLSWIEAFDNRCLVVVFLCCFCCFFPPSSATFWPCCQSRSVSLMSRRHSASQHAVKDVEGGVSGCQWICMYVCACVHTARRLTSTSSCYVIGLKDSLLHSKHDEFNVRMQSLILIMCRRVCI